MKRALVSLALAFGIGGIAVAQESPKLKQLTDGVGTATALALDAAGTRSDLATNGFRVGPLMGSGNSQALNLSLIKATIGQTTVDIGGAYSRLRGLILNAGTSFTVGDDGAMSLNVRAGSGISEILTQAGYKISNDAIVKVSFAHLTEMMDFLFPSGSDSAKVSQNTAGFSLRVRGNDLIRFFELSGYKTASGSKILGDKDYVINTNDMLQIMRDSRHIAGATTLGYDFRTVVALGSGNTSPTLDLTVGHSRSRFDTLLPTPGESHLVTGARLNFPIAEYGILSAGFRHDDSGSRYTVGATSSGLSVELFSMNPSGGGRKDHGGTLRWSQDFGSSESSRKGSSGQWNFSDPSRLPFSAQSYVQGRPYSTPYTVKAIVDQTAGPKLVVQYDKKKLPLESTLDEKTGILTTTLPDAPGSILSAVNTSKISVNGDNENVSSSFSVQGNSVIFQPKLLQLEKLAPGLNDLVVTTSNNYRITVQVEKGSVIVRGAKWEKLKDDSPDTFKCDKSKITVGSTSIVIADGACVLEDADNPKDFVSDIKYIVKNSKGEVLKLAELTPDTGYALFFTYKTGVWNKATNTLTVVQREEKKLMEFKTKNALVNPAPTGSTFTPTSTLKQGSLIAGAIGNLSCDNLDENGKQEICTYEVDGTNTDFALSGSSVILRNTQLAAGEHPLKIKVMDSAKNSKTVTVMIPIVLPENTAPDSVTFSQVGTLKAGSIKAGDVVGFLSCKDLSPIGPQDSCIYSSVKDDNLEVLSTGAVRLRKDLPAGEYTLDVTAKDSGNLSKTSTIKVIIDQKDNTPLQIGNTPCDTTTVTIGNTTTCSITPVDPDGISDVTATLNGLGLSVAKTILPDGKIRYSATLPSTVNTNDRSLIWRAIGKNPNGADESPQTATQIIKSVYPVDTPLTFGDFTGLTIFIAGETPSYSLPVADKDGFDPANITVLFGSVPATGVSISSGKLNFTAPAGLSAGPLTITVTAKGNNPDGTVNNTPVTKTTSVTVQPQPNLPPNALPDITPIAFVAGATGSTTLPATTDPEGKVITYAITGTFPAGFTFDPATRTFSWTQGMDPGAYTFTYKATDPSGLFATKPVTISVTAAQDAATIANAPTVSDITPTSAKVTVNISDANGVTDLACQLKDQAGTLIGSPVAPVNGVCTFTGLTPSTVYTVVTTGKANELQANGSTVAKPVAPDAPFTTAAAPDTTPPSLTSNQNLPASNIGQITTDILTFSEAIGSVIVGSFPPGMSITATRNGATVTLVTTTTASFTAFGNVSILLTVTDTASTPNSGTINVIKTINDVALISSGGFSGALLREIRVLDKAGFDPIDAVDLGGVIDPLNRTIIYSTVGLPTGLSINSTSGIITGIYDSDAGYGFTEDFIVVIFAKTANGQTIRTSITLKIEDRG